MEISRSRSLSLSFETAPDLPAASSYPPSYGNCRNNMQTMQGINLAPNATVSRPFIMKSSMSVDSATSSLLTTKKENFLSSMFGTVTSIIVQRFAKLPSAFMSTIGNTLSVTVVPNEGIISQEFFKNLTQSCETLSSENSKEIQESMRVPEILPNKQFCKTKSHLSQIFADDVKTNALSCKVPFNLKNDTIDHKESKEILYRDDKTDLNGEYTGYRVQETRDIICTNNTPTMKGLDKELLEVNDCERSVINPTVFRSDLKESLSSKSTVPKFADNFDEMATPEEKNTSTWSTVWEKVISGISERSTPRTPLPEAEVPTKKSNLAKSRRKTCPVARGRGKGRGKSQLRRSGVSQSRHRKERTKQNIYSNIQDDIEAWEDSERYDNSPEEESFSDRRNSNEKCSPCRDSDRTENCSMIFENFCFGEPLKSRKRKQRVRDGGVKCPLRVRYVPDSSSMEVETGTVFADEIDCSSRISNFRPRLVSESSVDSEDSCYIVFESGSDSEYTDYDYDSSDEDLDEGPTTTAPRVRFNLEPQVHMMLQWDYAYRAARPGPWEQMARDRDRFRDRIRAVERILAPVLSVQHRTCVWQDRFNAED